MFSESPFCGKLMEIVLIFVYISDPISTQLRVTGFVSVYFFQYFFEFETEEFHPVEK